VKTFLPLSKEEEEHTQLRKLSQPSDEQAGETSLHAIEIGAVFSFKVNKELSRGHDDYLVLEHRHFKAVCLKQHLSDFRQHYDGLLQLYRAGKGVRLEGKVIGFYGVAKKGILVSCKPSLLSRLNPNSFAELEQGALCTGYVWEVSRKFVKVRFNEATQGVMQIDE